jgi:nicotinamide mononucleotide transporter
LPGWQGAPPVTLEAWAVITGAQCEWLTVIRKVMNFPFSILACAITAVYLDRIKLFGDMYLQFFFIALAIHGWYWWLKGGENRSELPVTRARLFDWSVVALGIVGGTPLLIWLLTSKSSAPFWDAFTTAGSIVAQILLNRKKLENWFIWILMDIIYVPLYWSKGAKLMSVLYAVFLIMCVAGLRDWSKELRSRQHPEPAVA